MKGLPMKLVRQGLEFECPVLKWGITYEEGPITETKGWGSTNLGLVTIIKNDDFTVAVISSLFGPGTEVAIVATSVGDPTLSSRTIALKHDFPDYLQDINTGIEDCLYNLLSPSGWKKAA